MIKKILLLTIFAILSFANGLEVNQNIGSFSLPNQFDEKQTINSSIQTILVSFEKDTSKDVNDFLASKDKNFLKEHNAAFIADISGMPSIITKLFALPKMKKYNHKILLIYDEDDNKFSSQEGKITLYKLDNGVIKSISYITKNDFEGAFK